MSQHETVQRWVRRCTSLKPCVDTIDTHLRCISHARHRNYKTLMHRVTAIIAITEPQTGDGDKSARVTDPRVRDDSMRSVAANPITPKPQTPKPLTTE